MKLSVTLALIAFAGFVSHSSAFPAQKRVMYYQRPAKYYSGPQRLMYVQYMHPSPYARSTQATEALVAGESVATGTYLQDCDHADAAVSAAGPAVSYEAPTSVDIVGERGEEELSESAVHATQATAEAYPTAEESVTAFEVPLDVDIVAEENEVPDDEAKEARKVNFDGVHNNDAREVVEAGDTVDAVDAGQTVATDEIPDVPLVEVETPAEVPAETPVEVPTNVGATAAIPNSPAAAPVNKYLPAKKKVYVELDRSVEDTGLVVASEEATEEDDEDEEHAVAPVATVTRRPARRPTANRPAKAAPAAAKEQKPLPVGTFFPIDFGGTKGGAIAIANAFSTGEGGSATSHAIAYGSPDAASLRGCVSCKKH